MKVLAIDTSSKVLGVAVLDEEGPQAEFNYDFALRHTSHLVPTIKMLLKFMGMALDEIDGYCVSIGPGSFTGLRIGVAAVKAFAAVDNKMVAAVPSLDVLARNIPYADGQVCAVVDAKKEKFYACFYRYKNGKMTKRTPYLLIGYDELIKRTGNSEKDILLVGDGIEKIRLRGALKMRFADESFWYPKAMNVARIGLEMLKKGKTVKDVDALAPVYLFPRDVQCKR